jgi:hypothetical protein
MAGLPVGFLRLRGAQIGADVRRGNRLQGPKPISRGLSSSEKLTATVDSGGSAIA